MEKADNYSQKKLFLKKLYQALIFAALLLIFVFPFKVMSAPQQVYTDPETGYEIWKMAAGEFPYYTSTPFSANGKYLIYGRCLLVNTDGTNQHALSGSSDCIGEYGVMGWWSHDSRYYYAPQNLTVIDVVNNTASKIPNSSPSLPFYYGQLSPDGKTLFGVENRGDISNGVGVAKFINVDGTGYKTYSSPGRQTGGFDVTHGWTGNDTAWYLNNSQWTQYTDVPMVFNVKTGQFVGPLNVGDKTWNGIFDHPFLSSSGTMIGNGEGIIAGHGTGLKYANTKPTTNTSERQLTTIGSYMANHHNFSPDGKFLGGGATQGSAVDFVFMYSVPPVGSTSGGSLTKLARFRSAGGTQVGQNVNFSPDGTKASFTGYVGSTTVNMVILKKPGIPTDLTASINGSQVILSWKPATFHREIKEYEIHRSDSQNGTFTKVAAVPELYTYLDAPSKISASDTTISVDSTAGFPDAGVLEILGLSTEKPTELVSYTGKTATSFTGISRGYGGTAPAEHYNDAFVWLYRKYSGYSVPGQTGGWYKIKSIEWSALSSDLSPAVQAGEGGQITPIPTSPPDLSPSPTLVPGLSPTLTLPPGLSPTTDPGASLPGDINLDRSVDNQDYGILIADFWKTGAPGFIGADIIQNGKVDIFDYNILITNFGRTY